MSANNSTKRLSIFDNEDFELGESRKELEENKEEE